MIVDRYSSNLFSWAAGGSRCAVSTDDALSTCRSAVTASNWHYCRLGMDLLNQACQVTPDADGIEVVT